MSTRNERTLDRRNSCSLRGDGQPEDCVCEVSVEPEQDTNSSLDDTGMYVGVV